MSQRQDIRRVEGMTDAELRATVAKGRREGIEKLAEWLQRSPVEKIQKRRGRIEKEYDYQRKALLSPDPQHEGSFEESTLKMRMVDAELARR